MRIIPFPRRHRALWIAAAVLGVSAWGTWLASSGRTFDYGSGATSLAPAATPTPGASTPDVAVVASMPSTGMTDLAAEPYPHTSAPGLVVIADRPTAGVGDDEGSVVVAAPRSDLAGVTDPLAFAGAVADVVLSFGPEEDPARADVVLAVAALPPIGAPQELAADLDRLAPAPALVSSGATVEFAPDLVAPSAWAAPRMDQLRLPLGSFAIDVTGTQIVTVPGHDPVSISVTIGVTGACPPALPQCEIDRIFPRTVAQELGS
ncbi:MAG: hypothetical protein J0I11_06095 [Actinobacteria bacterium]|nr:hypothetical protein [Actinomycetota bacterium]